MKKKDVIIKRGERIKSRVEKKGKEKNGKQISQIGVSTQKEAALILKQA